MSIDYSRPAGTSITVNPEPEREATYSLGRKSFQKATPGDNNAEGFWGKDGFGFDDLIDLVNPLQHIPIVSSIYRAITGDEIAPGPRMVGGGLLGGVTGFMASAASVVVEQETGGDMATSLASFFGGDAAIETPDKPNIPITPEPQARMAKPKELDVSSLVPSALPPAALPPMTLPAPAALEALDFSDEDAVISPLPAAEISPQSKGMKLNREESILELFGAQLEQTYKDTQQAKAHDYTSAIARDMKG